MKRLSLIFIGILACSFLLQIFPGKVQASTFSSASMRLDRHKISTTTGAQVCVTTPSSNNGTENSLQIVFPSGFNVNSTASNWTVTTTNLPSGATAWPGIGTATAVNGVTVTFPSSDLSTSTQYCFNFSGTNTLTTRSTVGNYEATIRTRSAGSATIDSSAIGLSIISNDQITVTATVAAQSTDFQASLAQTSPTGDTFPQTTTLYYTLTYGSTLSYSTGITVEAQWSLGTIQGSGSPTVAILDYDTGSASNGYNSTAPVIDLTNRKISWTISSFPGNTSGETVTFRLKTNSSYTGSSPVSFTVSGRVLGPGATTADSDVTKDYQYNYGITPAPGNTGGPGDGLSDGRSSGSQPNPPFKITYVDIRNISNSQASIFASTNETSNITLQYGTSLNNLNSRVISNTLLFHHLITLSNLIPDTDYYFRIIAKNSSGTTLTSELYSLHTALTSVVPKIKLNSLILLSGDLILFDAYRDTQLNSEQNQLSNIELSKINTIVIPKNTPYSFKFSIADFDQIRQVRAIIRSKNVLGINNIGAIEPNSDGVSVIEITPGQFLGRLNSKSVTGFYQLIMSISDYYGNLTEQKIADIIVVDPMTVFQAGANEPLENAKATFYYYNPRTRIYQLLSPAILPIKNPAFSEPDGHFSTVLPQGKYKVEVGAIGYEKKTIEFTIGINRGETYPSVTLKRLPFSIANSIEWFTEIASDIVHSSTFYLSNLTTSGRFLEFMAVTTLFVFVLISLIATSSRFSIPFLLLPFFVIYHILILFKKIEFKDMYEGRITNALTNEHISNVMIYVASKTGKIISHTITNAFGEFYIRLPQNFSYKIMASKKGYKAKTQNVKGEDLKNGVKIQMEEIAKPQNHFAAGIVWYFGFILSSSFEAIIIVTLLLEILLGITFGWIKVAPFVVISLLNLFFWASYIRHTRSII